MKNILITLLLIAFVGCSKEDVPNDCGFGCEVTTSIGNPHCGKVVGGASYSDGCPFGYIVVLFNENEEPLGICLTENEPQYPIGYYYCKN